MLYRWLSDIDRVVSVCDAQLSAETQRCMAMFGEIVWHVLVNLGRTEGWCYCVAALKCLSVPNLDPDLLSASSARDLGTRF